MAGVGQHQMYASQYWHFEHPRHWINSGGLGTMGFAVPAALGAKVGQPDKRVLAIDGDGCFQMTAQELATSTTEKHPVHHGDLEQRVPGHGPPMAGAVLRGTVFGRLPRSRCAGLREARRGVRRGRLRADDPGEVDAVIEKAFSVEDRSVVIDFRVDPREMVFPMVPAGRVERRHHPRPRGRDTHERSRGGSDRMSNGSSGGGTLHTISVLVEDKPGVLTRVAGLFSARGFNIDSLAVGPTESSGLSRMTIVINVEHEAPRADHETAQQADQRDQDPRARARIRGRA